MRKTKINKSEAELPKCMGSLSKIANLFFIWQKKTITEGNVIRYSVSILFQTSLWYFSTGRRPPHLVSYKNVNIPYKEPYVFLKTIATICNASLVPNTVPNIGNRRITESIVILITIHT